MSTPDEAIGHIERGDWDEFLYDVNLAVRSRKATDEFRQAALKRAEVALKDAAERRRIRREEQK